MTASHRRNSLRQILAGLGWPMLWGTAAAVGFYYLLTTQVIQSTLVRRYTAGHPVEYIEVTMFFVGLAALVMRGGSILRQLIGMDQVTLPAAPPEGQSPTESAALLETLEQLPAVKRQSYFVQRLMHALQHVLRRGSADQLDDELKYLSEVDMMRAHEGYGFVRIIVWATPMLGFLGTVIGITLALGDLSPESLVNSPKDAMEGLLGGLSVAFDTTALALILSIFLMFLMFLISQVENQLLATVDRVASEQLGQRFTRLGSSRDPHLAAIERMAQTVIDSTQQLVQRQADIWQSSLEASTTRWQQWTETATEAVQTGIARSLDESVAGQAQRLLRVEEQAQQQATARWKALQEAVSENAQLMRQQQAALAQQGDLMLRILQATSEVQSLEESLNQNLRALAGAKNFEDTVMSLSAAIHLLNSRLALPAARTGKVQLQATSPTQDKAA